MAKSYNVAIDIAQVSKALEETDKGLKSISKQTLGIIARGTAKTITSAIKSTTQKRTGELAKGYTYSAKKSGESATVRPKNAENGSDVFAKVSVLSYGHTGPTKRAKSFTVAPRGFIQLGDMYIQTNAYQKDIDTMIEKQLAKYWGK